MLCQYPDKSCDHKHCDGGNIMFLICHVTSRVMSREPWRYNTKLITYKFSIISPGANSCLKVYVNYTWKPITASHQLSMFGSHWSSASGDISISHVT